MARGVAETIGVSVKFLTPNQVKEIWPLCDIEGIVGAIQHPEDGYIQPADLTQALARGARVAIPVPVTIADGLQTTSPGELTFAIAREHVRAIVTVSDDQLRDAMRFVFERMKLVVEPSGAAALAALLHGRVPGVAGKRVGAIVSGGNIDPVRYGELLRDDISAGDVLT